MKKECLTILCRIHRLKNVVVRLKCREVDGGGNERLEYVIIKDSMKDKNERLNVDVFFVLIGSTPHTDWLNDEIERNRESFITTGDDLKNRGVDHIFKRQPMKYETSMTGAGDVRMGSVKRVASAVGE